VLDTVADQKLQSHAANVGGDLMQGLEQMARRHDIVGEVRGAGLFLGVELVRDRHTLEPAGAEAAWVANQMREDGVLIGTDGPYHNVLKIRPPMPFDTADAKMLLQVLESALSTVPRGSSAR
jgi:4-aminobutyrate aminotransferase-like enzyme